MTTPPTHRMLLVDDNANEGFLIEDALNSAGWPVLITHYHGLAELTSQLHNQSANPERFDLVLIDYNLPGSSPEQLIQELRNHAMTRQAPIVVLSVISRDYDRERLLDEGVRGILVKPATVADYAAFAKDLETFIKPSEAQAAATSSPPTRRSTTRNFRPVP